MHHCEKTEEFTAEYEAFVFLKFKLLKCKSDWEHSSCVSAQAQGVWCDWIQAGTLWKWLLFVVTPLPAAACRAVTVIDSPVVILPKTAQLLVPLPPVITPTFSDTCLTAGRKDQAATLHINAHSPLALRQNFSLTGQLFSSILVEVSHSELKDNWTCQLFVSYHTQ